MDTFVWVDAPFLNECELRLLAYWFEWLNRDNVDSGTDRTCVILF